MAAYPGPVWRNSGQVAPLDWPLVHSPETNTTGPAGPHPNSTMRVLDTWCSLKAVLAMTATLGVACGGSGSDPGAFELLLPDGGAHSTANVRAGDLLGDGSPQLLVSESTRGELTWIRGPDDHVAIDADLGHPVRSHVVDIDGDGDRDVLVADIGILLPSDERVGRVLLLLNDGTHRFETLTLLDGVGRVVCAEAADLDDDGDLDIAVCVFGHIDTGKVVWLEQTAPLVFEERVLDPRPGAIHAFPFDADGDGDLDIAVSLSQVSEEVLLFRNEGAGAFTTEVLFSAGDDNYGMSGIELSDLDRDGDTDILFTNGDTNDAGFPEGFDPYQFHGLNWLENDGPGRFTVHDIVRHWGAYSVRAFDADGDSDLDLVLSSVQDTLFFPNVVPQTVIWLENDGAQGFTPHPLDIGLPPYIWSIEVVDLDGDGVDEIVGGSLDPAGGELGHRLVTFQIPR